MIIKCYQCPKAAEQLVPPALFTYISFICWTLHCSHFLHLHHILFWLTGCFSGFLFYFCMFGSIAWHAHLCLDRRRSAPVFWLLQLLFKYQWLPLL